MASGGKRAASIKSPAFPALRSNNHKITSDQDPHYNCIAWAAGNSQLFWWPNAVSYWPEGVSRDEKLDAFQAAYATIGYSTCKEGDVEGGFEKIAIYALLGKPTHAARQLSNGRWTSKLGKSYDIEHELAGLEGPLYGNVVMFMKRRVKSSP